MAESSKVFMEEAGNKKIDLALETLKNIPENKPLEPMPEGEINQKYLDGLKIIMEAFSEKRKMYNLDPAVLVDEYKQQFGLVSEQDHLDCLKMALKHSLEEIKKGKKVLIPVHGTEKYHKSQWMMSQALFGLIEDVAGKGSAYMVDATGNKGGIKESIRRTMEENKLNSKDISATVIDDMVWSGTQFMTLIQNTTLALEGVTEAPNSSVNAFVSCERNSVGLARAYNTNLRSVRTTRKDIPTKQLGYFLQEISGFGGLHITDTISQRAVVTEYNVPDHHSVAGYLQEWGRESTDGVDNTIAKARISDQVSILKNKGFMKNDERIFAFKQRVYPTPKYLQDKVKFQIGLD